jgi:hypothetical protein
MLMIEHVLQVLMINSFYRDRDHNAIYMLIDKRVDALHLFFVQLVRLADDEVIALFISGILYTGNTLAKKF